MPDDEGADRALRALGLAHRAGRAVVGTRAVLEAAEAGELELVVLAGDASGNARDRLARVRRDRTVRTVRLADRASLGAAVGRGPVVAVGVTDEGLAGRVTAAAAPRRRGRDETESRDGAEPSLQKKI